MRKELGLLNFICILVALGFLAMAVISALGSGDFLTIDNLFIITVCLVMALMFIVPALLHLHSQGKLPVPFVKRKAAPEVASWGATGSAQVRAASTPPLLDAKGRAVPPDVKAIMNRIGQTEAKDA
jgi:L-cystine uptake protein TcyP (sodium:dicarboxylate symporter family)